jgi:hypothetical protein
VKTLATTFGLALGCGLVVAFSADAGARCNLARDFPVSSSAMRSWQETHDTVFTPGAEAVVVQSICDSIPAVSDRSGVPEQEIDAGSAKAVSAYLGASAKRARTAPTFSALLAQDFILGARPEPQVLTGIALVTIVYRKTVDQLQVGGRLMPPVPNLMAEYGSLTIRGNRGGQLICQGSLNVGAGMANTFTC